MSLEEKSWRTKKGDEDQGRRTNRKSTSLRKKEGSGGSAGGPF
jgi:hypothetical protein